MHAGKNQYRRAVLAMTAGIFAGVGGAHCDAAAIHLLDEVIVTATKTAESPNEVPASVSIVTKEDMAAHNYSSVAQALGQLPGIYLDPTEDGGISMRGFGSSNILVMVDGQPVNSGWNGSVDWSMIPVENVEKIEVVRGAASSLYGGRAVGGGDTNHN